MPLIRLDNAGLHYGQLSLLDAVNFDLRRGEKVGLLGRNGAGKTTLLKVLAGDVALDSGERWVRPGSRIAWLQQNLPTASDTSVYDVVAAGLAETGRLLAEYHHLVQDAGHTDMQRLARVQEQLEARDGWMLQQRVESTISQLQLPGDSPMSALSGGWRRRVALAQALVGDPDVLLLDEPTNHLDIPAIRWLEEQLRALSCALVLITHDRRFLQNVVEEIAELDRGRLTRWRGDYHGFLRHREQQLEAEERARELFDKKLAQEETWIRQGIKARRTRNEGRVRALEAMREERRARRERSGTASFGIEAAGRSGKIVAQLEEVGHRFGDTEVIRDFSTVIRRGDRLGIVGANGAGKSTLVKILVGELQPSTGRVTLGTKLEVAYSDQLRSNLDPDKSLMDNVCGGQEFIDIDGRRRHAISYLGEFLFSPERVRMPVKALSGGEQNRAVLARLFSKPANLLVLDEPTNDLDIETLELLEEILLAFDGTVLLVSHDREFMDNVVTSVIVLDGQGGVTEHVGGFSDWEAAGGSLESRIDDGATGEALPAVRAPQAGGDAVSQEPSAPKKKLSYKEKLELEQLPGQIETLERRQQEFAATMSDPEFFKSGAEEIQRVSEELGSIEAQLDAAYARWGELEAAGAR